MAKKIERTVSEDEPQKEAKTRTGYFAELVDLMEAEIADNGTSARVTLIRPGWSANSRYYSKKVLEAAIPLFEGGQAYADHPGKSESKDRPERSIRDLVGWYEGVKQESDGRLTANLKIVQDWLRPVIVAAATQNKSLAGLSINALGRTRMGNADGKNGVIVEAIEKHNSTDIVTQPAAGGRFESLLASDSDGFTRDLLAAMPLDELTETLREARPDLVKAWHKEWKSARDTESVKAARAEADSLKSKIAESDEKNRANAEALVEAQREIAALKRAAQVDRILAESKLPKAWKSDLRQKMIEAKDEQDMAAIVAAEASKAAQLPRPLQIKGNAPATQKPLSASVAVRLNPISEALNTRPTRATNYNEWLRESKQPKL